MNKQPINYLQIDKRWKTLPYRVKGETSTIGGSGCGPTSAAMLIETLTGKIFTPIDACKWSVDHGYKALNQGTYYSYFVPQFKEFGISCKQLLTSRLQNKPDHPIHGQVKGYLEDGYYVIALMGPGLWTSGGHFIVVWAWDEIVHINDPASTRAARLRGDPELFKKQVRNYWLVDAREYNKGDDEMLSYEQWKNYMDRYRTELGQAPAADYAKESIEACIKAGIMKNIGTDDKPSIDRPESSLTRQEAAVMFNRAMNIK